MKGPSKSTLLVIFFLFVFFNVECQKKGEIAPFSDGLYFKYKVIVDIGSSGEIIYRIKEMNTEYEIIVEYSLTLLPETMKHIVDIWGFIKESTEIKKHAKKIKKLKEFKGRRIVIWISPKELQIGNKFKTSLGDLQVKEKRTWENWDVWVLKGNLGVEFYYDIKTGFLVGSHVPSLPMVGSTKRILIETNADILH